jgi:hypothetical protein
MSDAFDSTEITNEMALELTQVGQAGKPPRWHTVVAVSTLVMALFTAVGALLAGITAHDALLDKTTELMDTTIAENDRVSIEVLKAKVEILTELGESPDPMDIAMIEAYETEVTAFEEAAAFDESGLQAVSATHLILAVAVTTLSVGITLSGMAIIVNQKALWVAGLVVSSVGILGVGYGILSMMT